MVNPIVMLAWDLGLPPPGDALLETTGRPTGQPRRTPVCDGLDGDTFWLVAQRGHGADERQRLLAQAGLARRWCVRASAAMGTSPTDGTHRPGYPLIPTRAAAAKSQGRPADLIPIGRTGLVKCH